MDKHRITKALFQDLGLDESTGSTQLAESSSPAEPEYAELEGLAESHENVVSEEPVPSSPESEVGTGNEVPDVQQATLQPLSAPTRIP